MDTYLTTKDVAALLKISYEKALQLMHCEKLGSFKIGRIYRVSEHKLNAFLNPTETSQKPTLHKLPTFHTLGGNL